MNVEPLPGWWRESDAPLVYITLGSVLGDLPDAVAAYRAILDAVADLPARVLFTIGRAIEPDGLGAPPPHVHIEPWVPQEQVLPAADVVVAHGGSGTTFGALAAGVPLVLVPFFADQPVNSDRVAATGAAIVVASDTDPHPTRAVARPDPLRLRAAIESVLGDTSHRRAASRIAAEMRALPSVDEVVDALASDPRRTQPLAARRAQPHGPPLIAQERHWCADTSSTSVFLTAGFVFCDPLEGPPFFAVGEEAQRKCAVEQLLTNPLFVAVDAILVRVDGRTPVDIKRERFLAISPRGTAQLPADNILSTEENPVPPQETTFVTAAYVAMLRPLPPGEHTITVEIVGGPFAGTNAATIRVVPGA